MQSVDAMNEYIRYTAGYWGAISSIIVFVLAVAGIYIAHTILKKHFKEEL